MTQFITVKGIKRILNYLKLEIECGTCDTQHVHTTVKDTYTGLIVYSEIQHTEAFPERAKPDPFIPACDIKKWREHRAIRMCYLDMLRIGLITMEELQAIAQEQNNTVTEKQP